MSYYVRLDSFRINNTRSGHTDTDFVYFSVNQGGTTYGLGNSKAMGDLNNGIYPVGIEYGPLDDTTPAVINFSIVNSGHKNQTELDGAIKNLANTGMNWGINALLGQKMNIDPCTIGVMIPVVSDPVDNGAPQQNSIGDKINWKDTLACLGKFLVDSFLLPLIGPNCDGVVAADTIHLAPNQVAAWKAMGIHRETNRYPGSDSPSGCGSNSEYFVTWSVSPTPQSTPIALTTSNIIGHTRSLTVPVGGVTVPNISTDTVDEAIEDLGAAGLSLGPYMPLKPQAGNMVIVDHTNPAAGATVPVGTQVTLHLRYDQLGGMQSNVKNQALEPAQRQEHHRREHQPQLK